MGVLKAGSIAVCVAGAGLLGASPSPQPVASIAETTAVPAGAATLPNDSRVFIIATPQRAANRPGTTDRRGGVLIVFDGHDLREIQSIPICSRPRSIVADKFIQRIVIGCADAQITIVDARTSGVSALAGIDSLTLKAGESESPYVYALTRSGVAQIDALAGTLARTFAPAGMSGFDDFSISNSTPERLTLYDDDRAVTMDATRGSESAPMDQREFGRLRFPSANVAAQGAQIFALRGAGSLVRVTSGGTMERAPVCDSPTDVSWDERLGRLITICSSVDSATVEVVTTGIDGRGRRALSFPGGEAAPFEKPRFVRDRLSGRFAIVKTNTVHVIDPAAPADVYSVTVPGNVMGLALDDTSGDVFAAFLYADHGGGVERFNIRSAKPMLSASSGRLQDQGSGGVVFALMSIASLVAPPARLDPPGIRSPAQIVPLADGSFLVRELLSPKIGRLFNGAYTQEDVLTATATDLIRGYDGNLWFLELGDATGQHIARREAAGRVSEFRVGTDTPRNIVASGDGLYWFVGGFPSKKLGHLTYAGVMSVLDLDLPKSDDGFDYLTGLAGDKAGGFFVSSNRAIMHFDAQGRHPKKISLPFLFLGGFPRVSSLEDGALAVAYEQKLLIIDPNGRQRLYFPGLAFPQPSSPTVNDGEPAFLSGLEPRGPQCLMTGITRGARGSIWGVCHDAIVDVEVDGTVRLFRLAFEQSSPASLVRAADGSMWFAETTQSRIGQITASGELREIDI